MHKPLFPTDGYPYRHWLLAVLLGTVLFLLFDPLGQVDVNRFIFFLAFYFTGLIFSVPAFCAYLISYRLLSRTKINFIPARLLLSLVAIVGALISLYLIRWTTLVPLLTYPSGILLSAFLIRRKFQRSFTHR